MLASASTRSKPPWPTRWKPRPRRAFRSTCWTGPTRSPARAWKVPCWTQPIGASSAICTGEPVRHGMTMGELAKLFNAENKIGANLTVDPDAGLEARRLVRFHQSHLDQSLAQHAQPERRHALSRPLPAGVRRRTFPWAAAPMRRSSRSARISSGAGNWRTYLNQRQIPGIRVYPTTFTPIGIDIQGRQDRRRPLHHCQPRTARFHAARARARRGNPEAVSG